MVTAAVATAADIAERRCETALIRITSTSYRARRKTLEPLKAMTILRFATILTALIGSVSLSIAPLAFPQSDEDSTPSVWESDSIPPPPAADYLKLPPASATDSYSGTTDPAWEEVPETIRGPPPPVADYLKGPTGLGNRRLLRHSGTIPPGHPRTGGSRNELRRHCRTRTGARNSAGCECGPGRADEAPVGLSAGALTRTGSDALPLCSLATLQSLVVKSDRPVPCRLLSHLKD